MGVLYWTLFVASVFVHSSVIGAVNSEHLVRRMRRLEMRLAEDLMLLRQELYDELYSLRHNDNFTQQISLDDSGRNVDNDINDDHLTRDLNAFVAEVNAKLEYLQTGYQQEKRVVRSLRDNLQSTLVSETERSDLLESFIRNMSIDMSNSMREMASNWKTGLKSIHDEINTSRESPRETLRKPDRYSDCADLLRHGYVTSGEYTIYPETIWRPLRVYCDMTTAGGGWTVFQRRMDGSENFERLWLDYTFGFGNLSGEFWLGNEFIHRLTSRCPHELRIELEDFENDRRLAEYGLFSVGSSSDLFRLSVKFFSGNLTDSLIPSHNGHQFSTKDQGPSTGCSTSYKAGFWYSNCHAVNINGLYLKGEHKSYANGVNWSGWKGYHYSLKFTEMKFRPK